MRSALIRRARSVPPFAADALLGCALAVAAELEVLASASFPGADGAAAAAVPAITLALAWRRRAPLAAFAVVYGAYAAQALAGGHAEQSIAVSIALLVSIYSLAAHAGDGRIAVAGLPLGQGVAWMALALEGGRGPGDYAFSVLLGGGAWLGGYAVRSGRMVAMQLEGRVERAEAESAAERERAVAEERARIAREMHDVLAHTMSVVVVQTGAARQLVRAEPGRSEQLLRSTEATGRQALSEMRRLLGLIRADPEGLGVAPQPGLGDLDELVARARQAGLELQVEIQDGERALPIGIDLAAYRIAQEAITNAIKHGEGPATLALRYRPGQLEIELRNAIAEQPRDGGSGHGLIGMRERASLYDGTLEAGPTHSGEFRIYARLPLDEESE
ncbi:MAG: histidine kinase [Solirubrobacterales bacterium]